jgi:deoxyribonuclease IV
MVVRPVGAHVSGSGGIARALQRARERGGDALQVFSSNPRGWALPAGVPEDGPVELPLFLHAPYLVNLASPNNKIRIPSRKILQQTCDGAAEIGATAVIVHGGHVTEDDEPGAGFARWRKGIDTIETEVPIYLENTAGGDHAMARHFDTIAGLWDHIGDTGIGFCLDTCHAWAAGEALVDAVERILGITGRIDLVHCNDSKDEHGSGRDRHANIGTGTIDPELLVAVVTTAGAPVICETADEGRKDDIALLRAGTGE